MIDIKYIIFIILLVLLIGCSSGDKPITNKEDMKTVCLDGVTYYQFRETFMYSGYGYMSVKFNRDGTVHTCNPDSK
jgi:major membrane immunogen (membrane-anchored lipoprotein)